MSSRLGLITVLILFEIAAVVFAFQVRLDFQCSTTDVEAFCRLIQSLAARAIVLFAALAIFVGIFLGRSTDGSGAVLRGGRPEGVESNVPASQVTLRLGVSATPGRQWWMAVHMSGFALLLSPVLLFPGRDPSSFLSHALFLWVVGLGLSTLGAALWLATPERWMEWIKDKWRVVLPLVAFSLMVPDLAALGLWLWDQPVVVVATFSSVSAVLSLLGGAISTNAETRVIGYENFFVEIAPSCSGLEGLVLMASFVGIYGFLFRSHLRFPHYWIIVLPLSLLVSWCLNVVRVVSLVLIGARISPEIAVNGFHSYAGWMFFTLIAFGLVCLVHRVPALRREPDQRSRLPLSQDRNAARIIPLAIFLVTGVIGSAVTVDAGVAFPLRAAALATGLIFFRRHYYGLYCRPDAFSILAGVAVGLLWMATEAVAPAEDALQDTLSRFGPVLLTLWVVCSVVGVAVLVPIAEELFFRGYLLAEYNRSSRMMRVILVVVSSLSFAVLHERWIAALVAGLIFALVMLRRGRVADAVLAHVIANSIIMVPDLVAGRWAAL